MSYIYPMWFKVKDSDLVVKFNSLHGGEVIISDGINNVGDIRNPRNTSEIGWVKHTDTECWQDVTYQYKNEAPNCQHEVSFDEECSECEELLKKSTRPQVSHYQSGGIEPIDYINSHNMNFNCGCVVKYVSRNGKKDGESAIKDLQKAIDYLNFEIERLNNVAT